MKVVTGGAGFIGSALASRLAEMDEQVVVVDNFDATLYSPALKRRRAHLLEEKGVRVLEGNDLTCLGKEVPVTTVFNLAATAGLTPSWTKVDTYTSNNIASLGRSLAWLADFQPQTKVIHASTSSVYGKEVNQASALEFRPTSPYGVTKLAAEHLLKAYGEEFGIQGGILRLFSVYGPNQRADQLFSIALRKLAEGSVIRVYGDGSNARTNLYVADAVDAFLAADEKFRDGIICDVSGTESVTTLQVLDRLSFLLGKNLEIEFHGNRAGDQTSTVGNLEPARRLIGWSPRTSFQDGTQALVEDFLSNPEAY